MNTMCINAQDSLIILTSSRGMLPDNSDVLLAIILSGQRISGQSGIYNELLVIAGERRFLAVFGVRYLNVFSNF